jgi:hypothetical protein
VLEHCQVRFFPFFFCIIKKKKHQKPK